MNKIINVLKPYLAIVIIMSLFGGIVYATVDKGYSTKDNKATVICDLGFFYNVEGGYRPTIQNLKELEALALTQCGESDNNRDATSHRHLSGKYQGELKHAVLIEDSVCTINWELTPEAHHKAFIDVCLKE